MVHSGAGRQKACLALHRVFVVAVADVQIVVDGVVRYREIARCIVNPIIAKMINLVVREEHLVGCNRSAVPNIGDV